MPDPLEKLTYRGQSLRVTAPISASESVDLSGTGDYEFDNILRAVWIEISAVGQTITFRFAEDTRFQTRAIPATGWYPWRIAEVRRGSSTTITKLVGDYWGNDFHRSRY